MVRGLIEKLCAELSIPPVFKQHEKNFFLLPFAPGLEIALTDLNPGIGMRAIIASCPRRKKEECFTYLMRANLLGQGTGTSRIGLSEDEKNLTLSLSLPYEMNYHAFKEAFEEFANHLIYWRNAIANFEKETIV